MTDMPETMLRLVESARLLVLDPGAGPIYRPITELALGDEVLVVAADRMCFRRIIAIEDADPPVRIVVVPAGDIGPEIPARPLLLDALQPVAAPILPAPLRHASAGRSSAPVTTQELWVDVLADGAQRIIVENLAVGTERLPEPKPEERPPARPGRLRLSSLVPGNPEEPAAVSQGSGSAADVPPAQAGHTLPAGREPDRAIPIKAFSGPVELSLTNSVQDGPHTILRFVLPPRTTTLRLASPSAQPPGDGRRLGVAIFRLQLESVEIALDNPALIRGFHRAESGEGMTWRWTDGDAMLILPAKSMPQTLSISITDWHKMLSVD